eukprot:scaffold1113_cov77-Cylindrotheca_fusiformis.AAC.1
MMHSRKTQSSCWIAIVLVLWNNGGCILPTVQGGSTSSSLSYTDTDTHKAMVLPEKQLIFFAGPHNCASTSVEKFFHHWAENGFHKGHSHTKALQYWRWPRIVDEDKDNTDDDVEDNNNDDMKSYKAYGALVTDPKSYPLSNKVLGKIADKFNEATNGIILGTEEFDQLGGKDALYDAMPIMDKIAKHLDVSNNNIKVVLNYRTPRLDQWLSIWKHHDKDDYEGASYEKFLCDAHSNKEDKKIRYSMIGAEMNPLGAAMTFLNNHGWKVVLMDMAGVDKAGKHIVHTIGCDVLLGECNNGILGSLHDYLPDANNAADDERVINELSKEESSKIERLFRYRDCAYKSYMEKFIHSGQLEILYPQDDNFWEEYCTATHDSYYEKFLDNTPMMFNALLGQLQCNDNPHDLTIGTDMDAALTLQKNGNKKNGGSALFHAIIFPLILLGIIGGGIYTVMMKKQELQRIVMDHTNGGTEMTAFPESSNGGGGGFKDEEDDDDDDDNEEEENGGFHDDDELEDEEVLSDQNPNPIV